MFDNMQEPSRWEDRKDHPENDDDRAIRGFVFGFVLSISFVIFVAVTRYFVLKLTYP